MAKKTRAKSKALSVVIAVLVIAVIVLLIILGISLLKNRELSNENEQAGNAEEVTVKTIVA